VVKHGCARLVFSESDLLPGLVVDWYGSVLVIQSNTAGMDLVADVVCELLPDTVRRVLSLQTGSVVLRADSGVRGLEGAASFTRVVRGGGEDLSNGWVDEDGIRVAADFIGGQKTGYFLDQHDNRARFEAHVAGERAADVLDLCCYSGGWGLRALRAGARAVFVDQSAAALQLVERAVSVNGFDPARALCVNEDVFDFLERDTRSYDVIVADPPAFVKSRKSLARARKAYEKLNRLAWRRLKPDGALFTCSCSYHLDEHDFHDTVALAVSKENGLAQEFYRGTQAEDHPALLSMPETRYLKCLGLRKLR
jgi:23S rRNA (cytosine1962-C5)-methyltransferase